MSNVWGKTLLEMKRVGKVIGKSAGEIGGAIGEAAVNISAHTKKVAKVSILKAEMDNLYYELGKSVFEDGLMPSNEIAMVYMEELFKKSDELAILEAELGEEPDGCSCSCGDTCECDEDCTCGCTDEQPVEDVLTEDVPVEETSEEDTDKAE